MPDTLPEIILAVLVLAMLAFLVVRAVRSEDPDRWVVLLAQVFFLSLALWVFAALLTGFEIGGGRLDLVVDPIRELGGPASLVVKASFAAMAFALMFRAYRRLRT